MWRLFKICLYGLVTIAVIISLATAVSLAYFNNYLPNHKQLVNYKPKTMSRLYSKDGQLVKEYSTEKRIFAPISSIPKIVIDAFIAAEDKNFYTHFGIDPQGIARAMIHNLTSGKRMQGGSTINQQVAKNILLTNERSITRKIKEIILALRIDSTFSKQRILELYLNEIYLGGGAYGVTAAALNYFNKPVTELNVQEAALLAAMPKAPSRFNPRKDYDRALNRRNWVLKRMNEEKFISNYLYKQLVQSPIELRNHKQIVNNYSHSYTQEVRKIIESHFSKNAIYEDGLSIHTSLDTNLQKIAKNSLRHSLEQYSMRHGYMGPVAKIIAMNQWQQILQEYPRPDGIGDWQLAVILNINNDKQLIEIATDNKNNGHINFADIKWAKKEYGNSLNKKNRQFDEVFSLGDVIIVESGDKEKSPYQLRQIPKINGALIAMDPHTGHVRAMVGGFSSQDSQFNRATQAKRQPGSAFKPFVYLAALENGYTLADLINDEPIEFNNQTGKRNTKRTAINNADNWAEEVEAESKIWAPQNHSGNFYGPTTLRTALEKSRNVSTVHLGLSLGIDKIMEIAKRFGINDKPARNLSTVLGTSETTLLKLTTAYSMIANGGHKVTANIIDRIQNRRGETIFKSDTRTCKNCNIDSIFSKEAMIPPKIESNYIRITEPQNAYQTTSILEGVIKRGTARRAKSLNIPVAGKTGTTQNSRDSWFVGYSPNLVVGVYAGFDDATSLGKYEEGSTIALPAFIKFMQEATKGRKIYPFRIPKNIKMVKIDSRTGYLPSKQTPDDEILLEVFKSGSEPTISKLRTEQLPVINKDINNIPPDELPTSGIY